MFHKCDYRYQKYSITEHYLCVLYCEVSTLFTSIRPHWSKQSTTLYQQVSKNENNYIWKLHTRLNYCSTRRKHHKHLRRRPQQWVRAQQCVERNNGWEERRTRRATMSAGHYCTGSSQLAGSVGARRRAGHVPLTFRCNVTRCDGRRDAWLCTAAHSATHVVQETTTQRTRSATSQQTRRLPCLRVPRGDSADSLVVRRLRTTCESHATARASRGGNAMWLSATDSETGRRTTS